MVNANKSQYSGMGSLLRAAVIPTIAALAATAFFMRLGYWQLARAQEKTQLFQAFDQGMAHSVARLERYRPQARYRAIALTGRFDSRVIFLDNQVHGGRVGVHTLQAFMPSGGGPAILVNRGWAPLQAERALPPLAAREEVTVLHGLLDAPPRPGLRLGEVHYSGDWPQRVPYLELTALQQALQLELAPQIVLARSDPEAQLEQHWRPQVMAPQRHYGYALQWFGLATTVVAIWLLLLVRHYRRG